ncbi:MAG: metal ABC transporter substrate-binding protein, partial [Nitrososphaerota archaeon]
GEVLARVVKEVGGEYVEVRNILPPGVDPHSYEPSAQELLSLVSGASLIVVTGPNHYPVEEKIEQLSEEGLIRARVLDYKDYQREGLRLLEIDGGLNPHGYFYSLSGLRAIAKACAGELSRLMPDKSEYFEQRLSTYLERLALASEIIKQMNVAGVRVALVDPVLQYVAQDIGLEVEGVLIPVHGVEPSPEEVARIVRLAREGKIPLVLLSDIGLGEASAIMSSLEENDVPYALIPLLDFSDKPELAPVYAASIIKDRLRSGAGVRSASSLSEALLAPSLAANGVLVLITLLLIMKVRRHG